MSRTPMPKTISENKDLGCFVCTLGSGKQFLFDECDRELVDSYSWYVNSYGYAAVKYKGTTLMFHRESMQAPKGFDVDHINGNRADNRRCNLRVVTRAQNQQNKAIQSNSKTGHKNVFWVNGVQKWEVCIVKGGKKAFRKFFKDFDEACRVAEEKTNEIYGNYSIYKCRVEGGMI